MIKLIEYTNNQKSPSDDILEFINLINEKYNINDYISMMTYQPQPVQQSITRVVEEPPISQEESISIEE